MKSRIDPKTMEYSTLSKKNEGHLKVTANPQTKS